MDRAILCSGILLMLAVICGGQLIFPWMYPVEFAYWALGGPGIGAQIPDDGIAGSAHDSLNIPIDPTAARAKPADSPPKSNEPPADKPAAVKDTPDLDNAKKHNELSPAADTDVAKDKGDKKADGDKGTREVMHGNATRIPTVEEEDEELEEDEDQGGEGGASTMQSVQKADVKKTLEFSLLQFAKTLDKQKRMRKKVKTPSGAKV